MRNFQPEPATLPAGVCDHEHGRCAVWGDFDTAHTALAHQLVEGVEMVTISKRVESPPEYIDITIDIVNDATEEKQ